MARSMAFILITIFISAAAVAEAQAQACTLNSGKLAQVQELKGLRPGMTIEQVKVLVPKLEMGATDEFGLSKTSFSPDFNADINKAAFQGVRTVSLDFLDGRVASVWIGYNDTFKWKTMDEFVKGITQSLGLPDSWQSRQRGRQQVCGGYEVTVTMVAGSPTLRVVDTAANETWEKRRTEKAESEP